MKIILHKASAVKGLTKIAGVALDELDSLGVWDVDNFDVEATSDSEILLMEVRIR